MVPDRYGNDKYYGTDKREDPGPELAEKSEPTEAEESVLSEQLQTQAEPSEVESPPDIKQEQASIGQ